MGFHNFSPFSIILRAGHKSAHSLQWGMHLLKLKPELITLNTSNRLYGVDIPIVGLTGGIASGKSTVSELFKERGAAVICADNLVKKIYQTDEALEFVLTNFPHCIENNKITFPLLRKELVTNESSKNNFHRV